MPDYALDTHTNPHGFRVGILRMYIDLQITDKLLNVDLGAVGQHVANGVTGSSLIHVPSQHIIPGTIIGIVFYALPQNSACRWYRHTL